ncbi:hypothetical protein, partial [Klebsiella variicola]|uniref:hypothetical protein n=1 Tax=Klebsiella variicola TaxID=244366 RepID=UPI002B051925
LFCRVALRLPGLQMPPVSADTVGPRKRSAAGQSLITFQAALLRRYFAWWRLTPYPAYGVQTQYVNRRRTWGR